MPEMMLRLAEENKTIDVWRNQRDFKPGYTFVPIGESGAYIRNDVLSELSKKGGLFKKIVAGQKKFALAPMRRAFRTLVATNLFGLASKMKLTLDKDPQAVRSKWEKLGGKFEDLKKTVLIGAKRKKLLGEGDVEMIRDNACTHDMRHIKAKLIHYITHNLNDGYLSEDELNNKAEMLSNPAALLAAAVPILVAMKPLFAKHGADKSEPVLDANGDYVKNADGSIKMVESESKAEKLIDKGVELAHEAGLDVSIHTDPTAPEHQHKFDPEPGKDDAPKGGDGKIFGMDKKTVMFAGLGIAALFVLPKLIPHKQ